LVAAAENRGDSKAELEQLLGRGRAKKGMFEGDLQNGELEIGQVSAIIKSIESAQDIVTEVWNEYVQTLAALKSK
jgi:enoyl-[acyl-carrier protein] reductase II